MSYQVRVGEEVKISAQRKGAFFVSNAPCVVREIHEDGSVDVMYNGEMIKNVPPYPRKLAHEYFEWWYMDGSPYASLNDVPVGTKLISHVAKNRIGTVVEHGQTRGMDEVKIHWDNDAISIVWLHELTNRKYDAPE